jgi:hypothetical protein
MLLGGSDTGLEKTENEIGFFVGNVYVLYLLKITWD